MYAAECARIGPVDIAVHNGDLTDGEGKKGTIGLLTSDTAEQARMAVEACAVIQARHRYVTYGTGFHVVSTWSHEQAVAEAMDAEIFETLRLEVHGVRFNFRHVVGRSDVPYGQGTQLYKEAVREQLQAVMEERDAADVMVRSHVHYFFEARSSRKRAITSPCLQLCNPDGDGNVWARGLRTMYYDVGLLLIEVDNTGEVFPRERIFPLKTIVPRRYLCPELD